MKKVSFNDFIVLSRVVAHKYFFSNFASAKNECVMNEMKSETMMNACVRDNENDFACSVFASLSIRSSFIYFFLPVFRHCKSASSFVLDTYASASEKKNHSDGNIR